MGVARQSTASIPGTQALAVPLDATLLEGISCIVCLTAGTLVMQGLEGTSISYPMTAGQSLKFSPRKIMTATTGTYALHR